MQNFFICLNSIAPIFLIIFIGVILKKLNIIDKGFTDKATNLVFKVVLPTSLFWDIATSEIAKQFDLFLVLSAVLATFVLFFLGILVSKSKIVSDDKSRAAVAQGIFRSNYAILGMPLTKAVFGSSVAVNAGAILAICIPIFNILSVVIIEYSLNRKGGNILSNIIKNPLIIGVLLGGIFSFFKIPIPEFAAVTIGHIADMCLPLALLVIGGSMVFQNVKKCFKTAMAASAIKTIIAPVLFVIPAYFFGITGIKLGILFIFLASPSAISGYIMMRNMGGDYDLAGNIVLISTIMSFFSILTGILIMKTAGFY